MYTFEAVLLFDIVYHSRSCMEWRCCSASAAFVLTINIVQRQRKTVRSSRVGVADCVWVFRFCLSRPNAVVASHSPFKKKPCGSMIHESIGTRTAIHFLRRHHTEGVSRTIHFNRGRVGVHHAVALSFRSEEPSLSVHQPQSSQSQIVHHSYHFEQTITFKTFNQTNTMAAKTRSQTKPLKQEQPSVAVVVVSSSTTTTTTKQQPKAKAKQQRTTVSTAEASTKKPRRGKGSRKAKEETVSVTVGSASFAKNAAATNKAKKVKSTTKRCSKNTARSGCRLKEPQRGTATKQRTFVSWSEIPAWRRVVILVSLLVLTHSFCLLAHQKYQQTLQLAEHRRILEEQEAMRLFHQEKERRTKLWERQEAERKERERKEAERQAKLEAERQERERLEAERKAKLERKRQEDEAVIQHIFNGVEAEDACQVLGVKADATAKDVQKAYRKLARVVHPDKSAASLERTTVAFRVLDHAQGALLRKRGNDIVPLSSEHFYAFFYPCYYPFHYL